MIPVVDENKNQFTIVKGEDRQIPVALILSNKDLKSFSIQGNTEIKARFLDQNSAYLELTKTGGKILEVDTLSGRIAILLSETDSSSLMAGDHMDFEVSVTFSDGTIRIAQFRRRLNIKPRLSC